ncbi:VOC family protein [Erythrobacter sp. JK5]|uniref:VOC family protein n=1 Tax=Erythrobacter sp. JK5 TaxID=2829500 RepID=UPI001BA8C4E6|nr:VOC family protein [Erythrobacter sp. JK5]QUL38256.1 VOC family protein [Erythrobacter sp. JK5]
MTPIQFVASANHDEARDFYSNTMGFELTDDSPFALEYDTGNGMLRVQKVEQLTPHPFTALGWAVDDIAAARDRLAERGAGFASYDFLEQDERDIWTTPDGAQVCWFRDPDGNTLSLTQFPV